MNQQRVIGPKLSTRKVVSAAFILAMLLASSIFGLAYAASWQTQIVDEYGGPGVLALDNDGKPHLAFNAPTFYTRDNMTRKTWNIMYASWNGSGWTITKAIDIATIEDLAIDSNNNPCILYRDQRGLQTLNYAKWSGSNWTTQIIDSQGRFGVLALDSSNQPHVAYTASGNPIDLMYATFTDSRWKIQAIETTGPLNYVNDNSLSINLDSNDTVHIMYSVVDKVSVESSHYPTNIKYASQIGENWNVATVFKKASLYNMVLDSNGTPHFIYTLQQSGSRLCYAYRNGTIWNSSTVMEAPEKNAWRIDGPALALDSHDTAHIAFVNNTSGSILGNLLYGTQTDSGWTFETIGKNATWVDFVKIGVTDVPHINYAGLAKDWGHGIFNLNYATLDHQETKTEQPNNTNTIIVATLLSVILVATVFIIKRQFKTKK